MELLLASGNAKKLRELRELIEELGITILTPGDLGGLAQTVEDRPDFAGNAAKKASEAALATGMWTLADDSGLEVDALDGAPGVLSARFAGQHGDDAANNRLLLEKLHGLPTEQRGARFICALALARPDGTLAAEIEGSARGLILEEPRGSGDFGYDPLFLFTEPGHAASGKSFASLTPLEKTAVSHRGRALRKLASLLPTLVTAIT
ncbi:MAG: non-canonical purine NTP pyrophosphatase [bacterium]